MRSTWSSRTSCGTSTITDRKIRETAAPLAMAEITSAVIASSLVLLAVFIPCRVFPGNDGRDCTSSGNFALTIAATISISAFTALTLAPALAALMLESEEPKHGPFMRAVGAFIARVRAGYSRLLPGIVQQQRHAVLSVVFAVLLLVADGCSCSKSCRPALCPTKIRAS